MKIMNKIFGDLSVNQSKMKMDKIGEKTQEPVTQYSKEDEKIHQLFKKHQTPLTPEKLKAVNDFMNKTEGSTASKLETLDMALSKGVDITEDNLGAIHKALNEVPEAEAKTEPLKVGDLKKIYKALPDEVRELVDAKLKGGESLESALGSLSKTLIKNILKGEDKPVIGLEDHLDSSLQEDLDLLEKLEAGFEKIEEDLDFLYEAIDGQIQHENLIDFAQNRDFKKIIRTEVTEKMIELKQEFKSFKQAINKQLDQLTQDKPIVMNMKETLNSVIDKLDNILMKSDIPLYTDIKSERDLLRSSSQLADARVLLDNNQAKEAVKIIKDVKGVLDKITFEPSEQKIFGQGQKLFVDKLYEEGVIRSIPISMHTDPQVSPRAVVEILRGMGLNHEAELSDQLNRDRQTDNIKVNHNMKSILLKLEEDTSVKIAQKDNLENLTGQQLMNKLEYKEQKQKLMFNMPIKVDNNTKNLKVHVNAKKNNQKIDWKNSTLYFVVELDNIGDTGILVDINEGNANITIKNDLPGIESKIDPYINQVVDRLQDAGLKNFHVKYDVLNQKHEKAVESVVASPVKKEGFDFKI